MQDIEVNINNYFGLFGWNTEDSINRIVSILPKNWDVLEEKIKKEYLIYSNSAEFTLNKLKQII